MAVGRLDFSHRALRDARHDVFANRICVVLVIEAAVLWWRGALGSAHPTSVRGRRWNAVPTIRST